MDSVGEGRSDGAIVRAAVHVVPHSPRGPSTMRFFSRKPSTPSFAFGDATATNNDSLIFHSNPPKLGGPAEEAMAIWKAGLASGGMSKEKDVRSVDVINEQ